MDNLQGKAAAWYGVLRGEEGGDRGSQQWPSRGEER